MSPSPPWDTSGTRGRNREVPGRGCWEEDGQVQAHPSPLWTGGPRRPPLAVRESFQSLWVRTKGQILGMKLPPIRVPRLQHGMSRSSGLSLLGFITLDLPPEPWACVSPELFPPPVLRAIPSPEPREGSLVTLRCQTKLYPLRSASRLLFSFHKGGRILQDRGPHPELYIPGVKGGDSGLYWCEAAPEGGQVQKQSPQLEVRVQAPVSHPALTLHHGPTDPAVGDVVQLLCEAQRGSPPIRYSFYLDEKIVGNHSAPCGGITSLLFPVKSEHDGGNYSCEAENSVSRERSEPKKLSLKGSQALSTPTGSNWLVPWLPASLLGMMVIAAALLVYLRPWRKAGQQLSLAFLAAESLCQALRNL
ncbi:Fc receptor-like protein 6 isoform X1 [Sapajus apella]|uniref:Fc receptor-like protein 6 isoform X1 n=1 Tax=Sapajus apella TaxID=9515 RepID=A0A6J3GF82_SAPAP|nr:Fc receptor-like protein 6 isoform X1 [Sapajus apella]